MGHEQTIVDACAPEKIGKAIHKVNQTPGLRIRTGAEALWKLYLAPNHSMLRSEIESQFGAFDLHFGWFCRRVAEELGAANPDVLALVNYSQNEGGDQVLSLKPAVATAMEKFGKKS